VATVVSGTLTINHIYNANDQRIIQQVLTGVKPAVVATTLYVGNLYEETLSDPNHAYTVYYMLGDKMVGMREGTSSSSGTQYRLVGDDLGSTTLTIDTGSPPKVVYRAYYKPYGEVAFSSGTNQTSKGYTGQRLDISTGLMYYGARYYDPVLSYFISPDSIVPGAAQGQGGAAPTLEVDDKSKLAPLTVDFHESSFASTLSNEDMQLLQWGFWFQLSDSEKQQTPPSRGPMNPEALHRYAYVLNNPLRYTDPSGHYAPWTPLPVPGNPTNPRSGPLVINESNQTVLVYGKYQDEAGNVYEGWIPVPPGATSAGVGIYDAQAVIALDPNVPMGWEVSGEGVGDVGVPRCIDPMDPEGGGGICTNPVAVPFNSGYDYYKLEPNSVATVTNEEFAGQELLLVKSTSIRNNAPLLSNIPTTGDCRQAGSIRCPTNRGPQYENPPGLAPWGY